MAITHIANSTRQFGSSGQNPDHTHGFTILPGDLIVFHVHRGNNGNEPTTDETWGDTHFVDFGLAETAITFSGWMIAGGSEPPTYGFDLGDSTNHHIIMFQFRGSNLEANTTIGWKEGFNTDGNRAMFQNAFDGVAIPDDHLAVIFGGKDNRNNFSNYTTSNNSFSDAQFDDGCTAQCTNGIYRIFTTGETLSGNVTTLNTTTAPGDDTYSVGITFFEGAGGPSQSIVPLVIQQYFNQQR